MRNGKRHLALLAAAALAAAPAVARAGRWHMGATLICSDCHTMHNSTNGGQPMRYDSAAAGAPMLLRSANVTSLCLSCHNGQDPSAPKVMGSTLGDPPGGGFPADPTDPDHLAHDLTGTSELPLDGDTAVVMTCIACHDPHGSPNYRNLRPSPSGTGRAAGTPVVAITGPATGGPASVYASANLVYVSGMSTWCLDCHNNYAASATHPWDQAIYGGATTNYVWWSTGTGFNPRAPVQSPQYQATGTTPAVPAQDNQVFCLSCHKAHGSTLYRAELDFGSSTDPASLCNQCHYQ